MGEEKAWMTRCPAWKQGLVWRARDRREEPNEAGALRGHSWRDHCTKTGAKSNLDEGQGDGQVARPGSEGENMAVLRCQEVGVATGLMRDGARNCKTASSSSQTCPNLGVLFTG